jgi:hypothetical protein
MASSPWPCRLFGLDRAPLSPIEIVLLRVAALVALAVAFLTLRDVRTNCGADLRNRVVGARVMLAGHDPYSFVWQPGMSEQWLDPVDDPKVHRLTVPPPTLWLYAPIAPLPYPAQRLVSYVCEWTALLASVLLLVRLLPRQRHRVIFLLGTALFLVASDVWRLHVERGQVYVIHLLVLSLALYFLRRRGLDSIAAGVALGVLALMRPNLLLFAPALLVLGRWRSAAATGAVFGAGVLLTVSAMHPQTWPSYLAMGEQYYRLLMDPAALPDLDRPEHPNVVEGYDYSRSLTNVTSSTFAAVYQTWHQAGVLPGLNLGRASKLLMLLLAATLLGALCIRRQRRSPHLALTLIVTLALDSEFFLPHRWGYADVLLLAPLALALPALLRTDRASQAALAFVLVGLLAGQMGQHFLPLYAATLLRSWLVMGSVTTLAFLCWRQYVHEPRLTHSSLPPRLHAVQR